MLGRHSCQVSRYFYEYNVGVHMQTRAEKEFKKGLKAEDAPSCLRLVLHDAATYDIETGAGGLNGSIVLP